MTVLGAKIAHSELDSVCHLKPDELYLRSKIEKIPFHKWHEWIE